MDSRKAYKKSLLPGLLIALPLLFIGCSDSGGDGGITGTGGPLESYLKYGIAASNKSYHSCPACEDGIEASDDVDVSAPAESDDASDGDFSKTNTQEQGVDELDWLKTDGNLIYSYNGGSQVNIFELSDQVGKHAPANTIPLESDRQYLRGLYLDGSNDHQQLISVADEYENLYSDYFWHWHSGNSSIDVYDLSAPLDTVERVTSISIEGQYVSSRKIDSKLYIISQYSAYLDDYIVTPNEDKEVTRNNELINQSTLQDLLPTVTLNGESKVLLSEEDCTIPNQPEDATQPTLAIVTEIDLGNTDGIDFNSIKASCIAAPISTIYASMNAVYMVENTYDYQSDDSRYKSHIYKLDYKESGLQYRGKVSVDGQVGWNQQFRLSEYQDYLRVVTSDRTSSRSNIHRLHTILIDDAGLSLKATIPNDSAPEPIGKPGESIYSVRFNADKAYIVTFRRIDPFYVLDLSNHESPQVAGELELPGFSSYLHPFGEDLVFGLGRGSEVGESTDNIKLALFDVSDMESPQLINEQFLDGDRSYTPAEYSHTALSILPGNDGNSWRVGFAASILESWRWLNDAYYLFEVRGKEHIQGAGLDKVGKIVGSDSGNGASSNYYHSQFDRGVLTDTHVHYSHNGALITELWDDLR